MYERQGWMQRLDAFSDYLRSERQVGASSQRQYLSIVERWIDFVLPLGHDPGIYDRGLVDELLDRQRILTDGSRAGYTSNLGVWCRWVSGDAPPNAQSPARTGEQSDETAAWMARLESYLHWRGWAGGNEGEGAKPDTIKTVRSVVAGWIRWACDNGIDPGQADEPALGTYLDSKQNANDDTRGGYARHTRRWWKRQVLFMEARPERLARLVTEFRKEGYGGEGYPCEEDRQHKRARAEFEEILRSLPDLEYENRAAVKDVWKNARFNYGNVGRAWIHTNRLLDDVSEAEWPRIRSHLCELCFGGSDASSRIDVAIGELPGVRFLIATKLLALCHPEQIIPNYVIVADSSKYPGKLDAVGCLHNLALLDENASAEATAIAHDRDESGDGGIIVIRTNDLLLEVLRPQFADDVEVDTWGMSQFLYWLMRKFDLADDVQPVNGSVFPVDDDPEADDDAEPGDGETADPWISDAELVELSDEVLCDVGFLRDIVALLDGKKQVVLYGPPGTGKTYFARHLAWALARIPDDGEYVENGPYSLVQFHPAYSYEDFFEGFRPQVDDDGQMTYELTPGPLVRLAERAADHPDELHVMVIDEINRANLPRVLGELLYLLEYRDEWTQTQYRPVDGFTLPSNLWIIGTMNTADRSIALIDAAMRRRFNFVPFFPDREPTAGLLRRWCERNEPGQAWMTDLLDAVNQRLRGDLGGDYMLIGPSHFMKQDLDENSLRRIWEYNIEPLIEDQFFGRQEVIDSYRFGEVWKRHGPSAAAPASGMGTSDGSGEEAAPRSAHDESPESDGDQ
ncbi:McrB family protein [Candidatus Poriferisodalis sp.]|uniref:McrB family protein n=1 Tax=Candidatus Poriferisodalis sp. TaxID=3101277 RepID=UPI003AF85D64